MSGKKLAVKGEIWKKLSKLNKHYAINNFSSSLMRTSVGGEMEPYGVPSPSEIFSANFKFELNFEASRLVFFRSYNKRKVAQFPHHLRLIHRVDTSIAWTMKSGLAGGHDPACFLATSLLPPSICTDRLAIWFTYRQALEPSQRADPCSAGTESRSTQPDGVRMCSSRNT